MLEGKVGDFSLPEIFQLIALTKKTGTLTISAATQEGRVRFRDGEVSEAASDVRRLALGARLVAAGLVNEAQLAAALEAKRDHGGEVLRLLLEHAAIDEGALHAFVREHIADAVADMLRLDDASFRFDTEEAPPEPVIDVQVATDQLVTEGNQRLAEWEAIRQHVPSTDMVFAVAPAPLVDATQVVVDADDWQILALVDGRRPVREVVELSGRSEFSTSKALAGLVARKLVEPCGDDDDGHPLSSLLARREVLRRLEELELSEMPPRPSQPAPATEHTDPEPASDHPVPADRETESPPAGSDPPPAGGVPPLPDDAPPVGVDVPPLSDDAPPVGVDVPPPVEDGPGGDVARDGGSPVEGDAGAPGGGDTVPPAPSFDDPGGLALDGDLVGEGDGRGRGQRLAGVDAPVQDRRPDSGIDRAQVARELAALGLDEGVQPAARTPGAGQGAAAPERETDERDGGARRLVRDEELNRGLLLRLIDGVKGA